MLSVSFKVISKRVIVLQIRYFLKRFQKKNAVLEILFAINQNAKNS